MRFESINTQDVRTLYVLPIAFALVFAFATTSATAEGQGSPYPAGFDGFVVAMIDTVIDPAEMVFDGNIFFQDILGMTPAETDAFEAEAVAFFEQRFGLNADDPRLSLTRAYVNPELNYRVHHIAGRKIPPEGWALLDGSINLTVVDPAGVTLGGEFAGVHVPAGTLFPYGLYVIQPESPSQGSRISDTTLSKPLLIHFRGFEPMLTGPTGASTLRCQLFSEDFGNGLAQGIFVAQPLPGGTVRVAARNVMTMLKD